MVIAINESKIPPGQSVIDHFIIYSALGIPKVNIRQWKLKIGGLVKKKLILGYSDLVRLIDTEYIADFHCVISWSVRNVKWRGISISRIAQMAEIKPEVKWLFVKCLDGYTTIIPIEDVLNPQSMVVLEIDNLPLKPEMGFPARLFVPHLYGWKSAKWLSELIFTKKYRSGYWEERDYHKRGNVWLEERFKD
ncbi:MAG: molybdopterin-dependent oxidoreductase [Candidatus Njordarchaeales archaeon]